MADSTITREQEEAISRVRSGSLPVCENCGGQGYTDAGRSACAECHGAGVMTPELLAALSKMPDSRVDPQVWTAARSLDIAGAA